MHQTQSDDLATQDIVRRREERNWLARFEDVDSSVAYWVMGAVTLVGLGVVAELIRLIIGSILEVKENL